MKSRAGAAVGKNAAHQRLLLPLAPVLIDGSTAFIARENRTTMPPNSWGVPLPLFQFSLPISQ